MERILQYLSELSPDSSGEAWTLVSRIMAELDLTREEVYTETMRAKDDGLVRTIETLEPGPHGLLSVTIKGRGRRAR
jgi:hypothetical protein